MVSSRVLFGALAGAALMQAQMAQAATATAPCLSENEVTALVGYALPSVIDGTMKGCKPHLSANGYFATRGTEFLNRARTRTGRSPNPHSSSLAVRRTPRWQT